jgi:hypothetical protein
MTTLLEIRVFQVFFARQHVFRTPEGFLENRERFFTEREKPVKVFWRKKMFGEKPFPSVLQKTVRMVFHKL